MSYCVCYCSGADGFVPSHVISHATPRDAMPGVALPTDGETLRTLRLLWVRALQRCEQKSI